MKRTITKFHFHLCLSLKAGTNTLSHTRNNPINFCIRIHQHAKFISISQCVFLQNRPLQTRQMDSWTMFYLRTWKTLPLLHTQSWIFGEAFSCIFFLNTGFIEHNSVWLLFTVPCLEPSILTEDLQGGREPVSLTMLGVGFLPSIGDRGRGRGICNT